MSGRIPIDDAKRIATERRCPVVVVFGLHAEGNQYSLASYGMTRKLCKLGASFAEQIAACIADGRIQAPQEEPADAPKETP